MRYLKKFFGLESNYSNIHDKPIQRHYQNAVKKVSIKYNIEAKFNQPKENDVILEDVLSKIAHLANKFYLYKNSVRIYEHDGDYKVSFLLSDIESNEPPPFDITQTIIYYVTRIFDNSCFKVFYMYRYNGIFFVITYAQKWTYTDESVNNDYYFVVDEDEFSEATNQDSDNEFIISDSYTDFTDMEISEIKKLLNGRNWYFYNDYRNYDYDGNYEDTKAIMVVNASPDFKLKYNSIWTHTIFYAIKLEEEWIYAFDFVNRVYYKCDQFTGLIQLIKDKILK